MGGILYLLSKLIFFCGTVINRGSFKKPLEPEEEKRCIIAMKNGDKEAREKLINHNMRLVAHVVKKYSGSAENDDLISVGSIGLIKAVDSFSIEKGTSLATYTARCIENEILMLLRSNKKRKGEISLSEPIGQDKDGNELTLMDLLSEKEDVVFKEVDRSIEREKLLEFLKNHLSKREFTVICLRYGFYDNRNYAQREVAKILKISRSYISRIEKKAIEKLKSAATQQNFYC